MAIVSRDLDASERKEFFEYSSFPKTALLAVAGNSLLQSVVGISTVTQMFMMPMAGVLQSGKIYTKGNSGVPEVTLLNLRWNGTALASFAISISAMPCTLGTSIGPQGFSGLPAAGSTLLNLQEGDVLALVTSAANTAIGDFILQLVVKKTQDIVAFNGIST